MTQKLQLKEQPSWIFTNARTRSMRASAWTQPIAPTSPATKAAVCSLRFATTVTFSGRPAKRSTLEVGAAPRDVHATMRPGSPSCSLPALCERLVCDAAGADHRDISVRARQLVVAVAEQRLADLVHVSVRDLAAEEVDAERRHGVDRTRAPFSGLAMHVGDPAVDLDPLGPLVPGQVRLLGHQVARSDEDVGASFAAGGQGRPAARCSRRLSLPPGADPRARPGVRPPRRRSRRRFRASPRSRRSRHRHRSPGRSRAAPLRSRARPSRNRRRAVSSARAAGAARGRAGSSDARPFRMRGRDRRRRGGRRSGGVSQGGPIQSRPTRTGWWNMRQRSSQPALDVGALGRAEEMPDLLLACRVGVGDELDTAVALDLLEPLREQLDHGRARLLGAPFENLHGDAAQVAQRNALFSLSKKPSSWR